MMNWGFFAHKRINKLAVFTLPPEMITFYKKNIDFISDNAVNADKRRYIIKEEAPRHYLDIDHYGDSAIYTMPRYWNEAVDKLGADTLLAYGTLPWNINKVYYRLRDAFMVGDPEEILRLSADLGHYIGDAHVPLHTTENYDGQLTGQSGIHAFWESRLPELFADKYNFFVWRADYVQNPQLRIWDAIELSHNAVDSILKFEEKLHLDMDEKKYSFETKGRQTQKVISREYATAYDKLLSGMVERQMRASVKMIGDFWYSAWIDAGQPDLRALLVYKPTQQELLERREALQLFRKDSVSVRMHE
jgi:hypothetical protein